MTYTTHAESLGVKAPGNRASSLLPFPLDVFGTRGGSG